MPSKSQCRLETVGERAGLTFGGAPFLILGGELGNSTASSAADVERIFPQLAARGLNTVLVPAYWDLLEEREGQFDWTLTDRVIAAARKSDLKLIFLWFGAWKNSMSCYAPEWVKSDVTRFPRAQTAQGKPLEIVSAFSEALLAADLKAFEAWVQHVVKADFAFNVVMIQIENEIGMLESARDHSPAAEAAFRTPVPGQLVSYMQSHAATLNHRLLDPWTEHGRRGAGSWEVLFGEGEQTEEFFQAYYYARYVGKLAEAARKHTQIPLYVNAAMDSRNRRPGQYPSAGPLAHLVDIYKAAAPNIDLCAPDIYDPPFMAWAERYAQPGNPLFIPEMRLSGANAAQAFYAFGELGALGVSPFAIEQMLTSMDFRLTFAYNCLAKLAGVVNANRSQMRGMLFEGAKERFAASYDEVKVEARHFFTLPWDPRASDGSEWPVAGALLVHLAPNEFLLAGSGVVVTFAPAEGGGATTTTAALGEDGFALEGKETNSAKEKAWSGARKGILFVDEVEPRDDGSFKRVRRLNGDETHQGRHTRIGIDDFKILHIKLYDY